MRLLNLDAEQSQVFAHFGGVAGGLVVLDGIADRAVIVVIGMDEVFWF